MLRRLFPLLLLLGVGSAPAQQLSFTPPPASLPNIQPGGDDRPAGRPAPGVKAELTAFDYRCTDLIWKNDRWQLVAAGIKIKDFDQRELEAREALRIIRELRLDQHGFIGTPRPVMEYWLTDGRAPTATTAALRLLAFDPASLRVEDIKGNWCLRDGQRVYFVFGPHPEDALHALAVIRRYGFSQVGFVGQPIPVMVYFLSSQVHPAVPGPVVQAAPLPTAPAAPPAMRNFPTPETNPITPVSMHAPAVAVQPRLPASGPVVLPDMADLQDRVPFDWRQVRKVHESGNWKLVLGTYTLANFGRNERDAQQALMAARYYRFTEQCLVGNPTPSFSYFLVDGHAPRGLMLGVTNIPFQSERLLIQQLGNRYVLSDGNRPLMQFGDRVEDARRTLEFIKREQCDHLCRIGASEPVGMSFLVRAN